MSGFLLTFNNLTGWAVFKLCVVLLAAGFAGAMVFDALPKFTIRKDKTP